MVTRGRGDAEIAGVRGHSDTGTRRGSNAAPCVGDSGIDHADKR